MTCDCLARLERVLGDHLSKCRLDDHTLSVLHSIVRAAQREAVPKYPMVTYFDGRHEDDVRRDIAMAKWAREVAVPTLEHSQKEHICCKAELALASRPKEPT